jgi:ankyrin repeat protein
MHPCTPAHLQPARLARTQLLTWYGVNPASVAQAALKMLLSAGANPNIRDNLGGCALQEAVKAGHMDIMNMLVEAGAQLCLSPGDLAGQLCSLVNDGNEQLLGRYITAGADVNVGDYDDRTALHIAAAEGKLDMVRELRHPAATAAAMHTTALTVATLLSLGGVLTHVSWSALDIGQHRYRKLLLSISQHRVSAPTHGRIPNITTSGSHQHCSPCGLYGWQATDALSRLPVVTTTPCSTQVKLLVEKGGASPLVQDRWGNSPLAEATRVKAQDVVAYLKQAAAA